MKVSKEFKVGLLAVVSIAILYMGVNFLKGIDFFSSTNYYYAVYDEVDGLDVSNDVILNGLSVGRVSDISIITNRQNKILVELDVDSDIRLGRNSIAMLKNSDFLGSKAIELIIETPIEGLLYDGDTLTSEVDKGLAGMLLESAGPVADDLGATLRRLNIILESLSNNTGYITSTLRNLDQASLSLKGAVAENRGTLNETLVNFNQVALQLSESLRELPPVLIKTGQIADSIRSLEFSETIKKTQDAVDKLNSAVSKINEGDGTLAKLINDDSLYVNLNQATGNLDKLLIDLRENPGRYIQFSVFGKKE